MNESTIQPVVVESPNMPNWAQIGAELACGKLPTHISSQESPKRFEARIGLKKSVFTCDECPQRYCELFKHAEETHLSFYVYKIERCSPCNIKYKRWQRVRRAFKWLGEICKDKKCRPKFLTITKTLRTQAHPFTEEEIEKDRMKMCKEFRMTRKSKAWPNKYAGIWVYEAKVRAPGDEIRARWPDSDGNHPVIRIAENFELHGHIHAALATRYIKREPLLERHEGIHVKASGIEHMKKYLMGYMLVDTVGRYNRIGGENTWN